MPPTLGPLPVDDLTPTHLAGIHQVHVSDPAKPGFHAWIPVPNRRVRAGEPPAVLDVAIDRDRVEEDLAAVQTIIASTGSE